MNNKSKFDAIIIGGGPAGISSALWCDELGLEAILLDSRSELGGQLLSTYNSIENYLGIEAKSGREMRDIFVSQLRKRNLALRLNSKVIDVDVGRKEVTLKDGSVLFAKALFIATGVKRRRLGIKGEKKFKGRGVLVSGKRDKDLVKNKTVLIIGGGDAAFENTDILSETASKVVLVHRREKFTARKEFLERAFKNAKVEIVTNTIVKKIIGEAKVEKVSLQNLPDGKIYSINTDVVLLRIGVEPNTEFLGDKVKLDGNGYVKIDPNCETSQTDIFAVGDVANPLSPTISSAIGMAATAVKTFCSKQ